VLYEYVGLVLISGLALVAAAAWAHRPGAWIPAKLLLAAVSLRILGGLARHEVLFAFYHGVGDATGYYGDGLRIAGLIRDLQISPFTFSFWAADAGSWWGTAFVAKVSSLVLFFIGPTMRGEFVVFSLLSFLGLYAIACGLRNVQGGPQPLVATAWIWCWPSLWFWPSSVGKEAILLLAIGLVTLGYAGKRERIRWLPYLAGLGLAFCIRPHVAAALALATVAAHWFGSWRGFGARRLLEALLFIAVSIAAFDGMKAQFGLADADLEGLTEYVQFRAQQTQQGGSEISSVSFGPLAFPMAFINVWMRPFVWEAHNLTNLLAAFELLVLWGLAWHRRAEILVAIRHWRRHRLLRFGVPLIAGYTLMIGLTFSNLGIIARQRSPIFPFVLILILAVPAKAGGRRSPARDVSARAQNGHGPGSPRPRVASESP
jgi:hypothetical protein